MAACCIRKHQKERSAVENRNARLKHMEKNCDSIEETKERN